MKKLILLSILLIVGCDLLQEEDVRGCTDSTAYNYNTDATIDDNSCEYLPFHEITDFETINGMDEFGYPTYIIGDGIWGACRDANQNYNNQNISQIHSTIINRVDNPSSSYIIRTDSTVILQSNDYIGGVQMMLSHGSDFVITLTTDALISEYVTLNDTTNLVIVSPESELLFHYSGDFNIINLIVANSHSEVSVDILYNDSSLSPPYPNPLNGSTSILISLDEADSITVIIVDDNYNGVATLLDGYLDAGEYLLTWDATNIQNGNYRIIADLGTKQCFINMNKDTN